MTAKSRSWILVLARYLLFEDISGHASYIMFGNPEIYDSIDSIVDTLTCM